MPEGGCLCGNIRISYTGDPIIQGLCHCNDCRKISGSAFSTNILVPESSLRLLEGVPKTFEKKADSGKSIKSYFCDACGTTCFREGESFPGMKIIKAGILDVVDIKPSLEGYADSRLNWVAACEGARQIERPRQRL